MAKVDIVRNIKNNIGFGSTEIYVVRVSNKILLEYIYPFVSPNGFYTAVKILSINDTRDNAKNDEVVFEYVIQTNGSSDFTQ
jgi:hypothetical protein